MARFTRTRPVVSAPSRPMRSLPRPFWWFGESWKRCLQTRCRGCTGWRATWWRATTRRIAGGSMRRRVLKRERRPPDPGREGDDPRLCEAWAQLSSSDREVLALVAWEELSVADAARVFGCTAPVFSVRLHRARRRLQRLLAQDQSLSSIDPVEA